MSARLLRGAALVATFVPLALVVLPAPVLGQQPWKPSITWNTYLGGTQDEELNDIATTANDEVFAVGSTGSTSGFPADAGLPSSTTGEDAFIARFNPDGTLAWAHVFGGNGNDTATQVRLAVDGSGDVFVAGTFSESSSGFVSSTGTLIPVQGYAYRGGGADAFLARLSANGELLWFLFLGGTNTDEGISLAVDASRAYVGGKTRSSSTSFSGGTKYGLRGDGVDAFVCQVNVANRNSPSLVWTRFFGTKDTNDFPIEAFADDAAYSLVVQPGSLYVGGIVGSRISDVDETLRVIEPFHKGDDDGFVAKLTPTGDVTWFANVGGPSEEDDDEVRALVARPDGGLFVLGETTSASYQIRPPQQSSGTDRDIFVLRMSAEGGIETGARVGGGSEELMGNASLDESGNLFLSGRTQSSTDFALNAFDNQYNPSTDGFIAMLDPLLRPVWASYVGGSSTNEEWVWGVSAGRQGRLTFAGDSPAPSGVLQVNAGHDGTTSGREAFLFRVEVDLSAPLTPRGGQVLGTISENGIVAIWGGFTDSTKNFSDPETGIRRYEWALGHSGQSDNVRPFTSVGAETTETSIDFKPEVGLTYTVTVRATNGVGRVSDNATSTGLTWAPQDAGTGGIPDPIPDPIPEEVDPQSPLGWGCGSTGGGGLAGALGLVALASLLVRRARRASTSER